MKDYYAILDYLIEWVNKNKRISAISLTQKREYLESKGIDKKLEREMFKQLKVDGYIIDNDFKETRYDNPYLITFAGYLFIDSGKYKEKNINDAQDDARIIRNEKLLRNYTLALVFGTVGLVIVEMMINYHELRHFFCEHFFYSR